MNNNKAFTLAEVLITLGIIGIVAAVTLPTVIDNSRKKQLETAFKKSYSIVQQALANYMAEYEYPLIPAHSTGGNSQNSLKNLIKPYLNVAIDCGYSSTNRCLRLSDDNSVIDRASSYYKTFSNKPLVRDYLDDGQLILIDGSTIYFEDNAKNSDLERFITIDVNGFEKRPNKLGYDLFAFQLMKDGQFLPMGSPGTNYTNDSRYCSINGSSIVNGMSCTDNAMNEKDYFKNLP